MAGTADSEGLDLGPQLAHTIGPFMAISTLAVVLRFWSRYLIQDGRKMWWDDWTCAIAWVIGFALSAIGLVWVDRGLGRHHDQVSFDDAVMGLKLTWVSYILFILGVGAIKTSALLFYQRVFAPSRSFCRAIYVVHALVGTWTVAFLMTGIFGCMPVQRFWEPGLEGTCVQLLPSYLACSICDAILDAIVLVLPLPMVWRLKSSTLHKITFTFVFVCACLALVPSLGRMASIIQQGANIGNDFPRNAFQDLLWSYIEVPVGIVSLCFPSLFMLFKRCWLHSFGALFTTRIFPSLFMLFKRCWLHGFGAPFTTRISTSQAPSDAEHPSKSTATCSATLTHEDTMSTIAGPASSIPPTDYDPVFAKYATHIVHKRFSDES